MSEKRKLEAQKAHWERTIAGREKTIAQIDAALAGSVTPTQRAKLERQRAEQVRWLEPNQAHLDAVNASLAALEKDNADVTG